MIFKTSLLSIGLLACVSFHSLATVVSTPKPTFEVYISALKAQAIEQGFDADFVESAFADVTFYKRAVKADKNQSSMKKLRNLRERATNRSEFAKKPLKLGGMVFQPSNPDRAIIIVNDRAYSQGESIDDETTVRTIRPGLVTFVYRTEEINRRVD